jgi:hypothetical protein
VAGAGTCDAVALQTIMFARSKDNDMAKGQVRKSREAKKPKQEKTKAIAAAPSLKGVVQLGEHKKPKK